MITNNWKWICLSDDIRPVSIMNFVSYRFKHSSLAWFCISLFDDLDLTLYKWINCAVQPTYTKCIQLWYAFCIKLWFIVYVYR